MKEVGLPRGWTRARLGELVTVIRGASPRPKGDPHYFGGNIPWITIGDVTRAQGHYLRKTREGVIEAGARLSRPLSAGTLILSNSGTVCVPIILDMPGCIHDGFVAFQDIPDSLNQVFLCEYFNWIRPQIISENCQGMTQVNLNTEIVRNFEIPLPPKLEQQRIVDALGLGAYEIGCGNGGARACAGESEALSGIRTESGRRGSPRSDRS